MREPDAEALDDGRLATAGRAEEHRIALRLAQQDLDDRLDLAVAADDGPELAGAAKRGQIAAEALERGRRRCALCPVLGRLLSVLRRYRLSAGHERRRNCLLEQVDRLVRQAAIDDRLDREVEQDLQRVVRNGHTARRRDLVAQRFEDRQRRGRVELADFERRQSPRERVVTRDRRPIVVAGRGSDDGDVAARQRRLQHGRSAQAAFRLAGRFEQVDLIEKQDDAGL